MRSSAPVPPRPASAPRRVRLRFLPLEDRTAPAFVGGVNVAVADINGDSFPDLVGGQTTQGCLVTAVDGQTGTVLYTFPAYESSFTGGVYVAAGDLDGDGDAEIVTGTGATGGPRVRVFDGSTAQLLAEFFPYEESFRGGVIVAVGDTDGDGRAEVITGTGPTGGPRVQIFDAATFTAIANFFPYEDSFRGGVLVGCGDTDGDGRAEVITGTGVGGGPRVQIVDAATQLPRSDFFAYEDAFRGGVLVGAADTDGDGRAEVLTGTGPGGGPVVTVFDGATVTEEGRFLAFSPEFAGGVNVAGGDLTGDGRAEIVCGIGPGGLPTVNAITPDGSAVYLSVSLFDPVGVPGVAFSVPSGGGGITTGVPTGSAVGLTTNIDRAVVGTNQQVVFSARANGTPRRVRLFKADSAGNAGEYLQDLLDDGDYANRDAAAGDGTFSTLVTVNFPAAGPQGYVALAEVNGSDVALPATVTAVDLLADAVVQARVAETAAFQDQLEGLLGQGVPQADALAQVAAAARASTTIDPNSVVIDALGVSWISVDGLPATVTSVVNGAEKSAAAAAPTTRTAGPISDAATGDEECKGKALVLAPFWLDFEVLNGVNGDESDDISAKLKTQGYEVTEKYNVLLNEQVSVDDFIDWSEYDVVVVSTHGKPLARAGGEVVLSSGERITDALLKKYEIGIRLGVVVQLGKSFGLTPAFFSLFAGQMKEGSVVYISACYSAADARVDNTNFDSTSAFARAFVNQGAGLYAGYSDAVQPSFAVPHGLAMFDHLLASKTFGTIPGAGRDQEQDITPAVFKVFSNTPDARLDPKCDLLQNYDLAVAYTWPTNQKDLDTGTLFLGATVGFQGSGSPYMAFSGDDTSTGGRETVTVNLFQAFQDGAWSVTVPVDLRAGWYIPAGGSGAATVSVALVHKTTGKKVGTANLSISPGMQSGLATTPVGKVTVTVEGDPGAEHVEFTVA